MFTRLLLVIAVLTSLNPVAAQETLFEQIHSPTPGFDGSFHSNQLPSHPNPIDDGRTRVWDNFQFDTRVDLASIAWSGGFDGPFKPAGPNPELDFSIEIFASESGRPQLDTLVASWLLDSGLAGENDGVDVISTPREESNGQGGIVTDYAVELPSPTRIGAGDYWLSITAVQTFPNPDPADDPVNGFFDPGWGWHFGEGDDGSVRFDAFVDANEPGRAASRDLAFQLVGELVIGIEGDFDGDDLLTATDIDFLAEAIRGQNTNLEFDLNGDLAVDSLDHRTWVVELAGTLFGDSNLDQSVSFEDFLKLSGSFGQPGGWADGDFDGTGDVAFSDFLLLSQNFGQSVAAVSSVPEPSTNVLAFWGFVMALLVRRMLRPNAI